MNRPRIIEIAGAPSTGKSTLLEGLRMITEHRKDVRYVKDSARTYLEQIVKQVDTLTDAERCEMQRLLFTEILEEVCWSEKQKMLLIIDSGLVTNLAYSEGVVGEEFFKNQMNIVRSFIRNMSYSILYTPAYFGLVQDGLRQTCVEDQQKIDQNIQRMFLEAGSPHYKMNGGSESERALEAYDFIFSPSYGL